MRRGKETSGRVLLFYKYVDVVNPLELQEWFTDLCGRLDLTGKIRISTEGINVTLGGTIEATDEFLVELKKKSEFSDIPIKTSPGGRDAFDELKVSVVREAIPLDIPLDIATAKDTATHLTPDEVHNLLSNPPEDFVILDARNYYESRIGRFSGAIMPPIRKFSSFPKYLHQNKELFQDKKVLMYCTGGIRCERGSAYLKSMNICKEIYQIEGGIHEYINKHPEGYFRGKNYVFDNRVALPANSDILSTCNFCSRPYDDYELCCRDKCCIVTLCCDECKKLKNGVFYCCPLCEDMATGKISQSPCHCTTKRFNYKDVEEYYQALKTSSPNNIHQDPQNIQ